MHHGLWLLVGLRLRGWARRVYRGANTVRGVGRDVKQTGQAVKDVAQ